MASMEGNHIHTEEGSRDEGCQVEEDRLVHCWAKLAFCVTSSCEILGVT